MERHSTTADNTFLIRYPGLKEREIITNRTTLARRIRHQGFPRPIRLGPNSVAWRLADVEAWLARREAETAEHSEVSA